MKFPYIQLFAGDYLSDPKLSLCSAATRGVWMDFLCVMHMNDRCGVITGTREQLARLGRCSVVEVSTAIDELKHTQTADVTERNGIVTIICRRMKRDADARKSGRLRVQKHREHVSVTPKETQKPLLEYGTGNGDSLLPLDGESEGKPADAPELIYAEYPKKVAKPNAIRAIGKAVKKYGFAFVLGKTREYAIAVEFKDRQYIPNPEAFFNQERFNDSPDTWNSKKVGATEEDHKKPW